VLEKTLHSIMISPTGISLKWTDNPYIFVLYAGLAAGIFEEVGRYIGFKLFLKDKTRYGDGLSLGIGHGGMEALLVGAFAGIYAIIFAHMINSGTMPDVSSQVSSAQLADIKHHFVSQGFGTYFIAGIERIVAVIIQMFLSLVVLLAIRRDSFKYVLYAIGLHAVFDFVPAMYQATIIRSLWISEVILIIFGIIAAFMIFKMKRLYFEE
ncbi:MAG TPA: YhfC family glutamic-type intramembrane protease, partial [Sporolactobacillaceae bacterium]|nr:YhfC family glutamic-type intramembrane protease [Sporolactobacillaceae bacterium]